MARESVLEFPRPEGVLVLIHGDALPSEADAFHLQSHALLVSHIAPQSDLASGAEHALPRQRIT